MDAASDWIGKHQETACNIYFEPNETAPGCSPKPGKAEMVATLCRFADVDPQDNLFPLKDERFRLTRLAEHLSKDPGVPPTAIIDSGSGIQIIWAVEREAPLSPDVIARVEGETRAIEDALGAGRTHNVDRPLRLPGTVNFPNR
jgi:Mesyanzhinovviridae DNA primase